MENLPGNLGCPKAKSGWLDKQATFNVEPWCYNGTQLYNGLGHKISAVLLPGFAINW